MRVINHESLVKFLHCVCFILFTSRDSECENDFITKLTDNMLSSFIRSKRGQILSLSISFSLGVKEPLLPKKSKTKQDLHGVAFVELFITTCDVVQRKDLLSLTSC